MDIEFHYYMTYLIAARAGFSPEQARLIAHSAQYVDENVQSLSINTGSAHEFKGQLSQAFSLDDIPLDAPGQIQIYSVFHFIPGDPKSPTAVRTDGQTHILNTTPNSKNANTIFEIALASDDLYRIGIACHGYVDSWAHQNFIGIKDDFNKIPSADFFDFKWALPNLGHADALHNPDIPCLLWQDPRLSESTINNKKRFLEAAESLYRHFFIYIASSDPTPEDIQQLKSDLDEAIGPTNLDGSGKELREQRYKNLAETLAYGETQLPQFDRKEWMETSVGKKLEPGDDERTAARTTSGEWEYFWLNEDSYKESHWYKFQKAVKQHQSDTLSYLREAVPGFTGFLL